MSWPTPRIWLHRTLLHAQAQAIAGAIVDTGRSDTEVRPARGVKIPPGELRGIPIMDIGVPGTSPGTQPELEAIRRLA